jgi:hypothetical protein
MKNISEFLEEYGMLFLVAGYIIFTILLSLFFLSKINAQTVGFTSPNFLGNHVTVGAEFQSLPNVGAYSLKLTYVPDKLHLDTLISNDTGTFLYGVTNDTIAIAWYSINPIYQPIAFALHFTCLKTGCSDLTWIPGTCDVADIYGNCYSVSFQDTQVCYAVVGIRNIFPFRVKQKSWLGNYDLLGRKVR